MSGWRWEPFEAPILRGNERGFVNAYYQVVVRDLEPPMLAHLSIKRVNRAPLHDWRDLQRIKSELLGDEVEAVELFPAESRLVDGANQYHLWAIRPPGRFPFGFEDGRLVTEDPPLGAVQRPWPDDAKPAGLITAAELIARIGERAARRLGPGDA